MLLAGTEYSFSSSEKAKLMDKPIYTEGPLNCDVCFIGEAPGKQEVLQNRPFVGATGKLFNRLLSSAGISRAECRIENVLQFRPKNNNMKPYFSYTRGKVKESSKYIEAKEQLIERLTACTANVFVPFGNAALYALCEEVQITKRRGSILTSPALNNRKVIPTIHPAASFHTYTYRYYIMNDLNLISKESKYPDVRLPHHEYLIEPTYPQVLEFINEAKEHNLVCFDIEVNYEEVSHISLCYNPAVSLCIPFVKDGRDYFTSQQESQIMYELGLLFEDTKITKVNQNIDFDNNFLLRKYGIRVRNVDDTMVAMGILYPEFPKSLDFIQSLYCDGEPYYKDTGKKWFKNPFGSDERFRLYSAKDAVIPMITFPRLKRDLERMRNLETYQAQKSLIEPLTFMQERGMRIDSKGKDAASNEQQARIEELERELDVLCDGQIDNYNSPKQVAEYFYDYLGLKPYRKKGKPTTDEKALTRIARKGYKEAQLMLERRGAAKMKGTYYDMHLDSDNRLRCSFNPVGTVGARLSSSKTIFGTGGNMQNLPWRMKRFILADPNYILVEVDLSQAENRVVAYVANETRMIEAFEFGIDIHSQTAALIFGKKVEDVSREKGSTNIGGGQYSERDIGKKTNHGLNYGQGYRSFSLQISVPEKEGRFLVESYHKIYPGVRRYQEMVRQQLSQDRTLITPFGRRRKFREAWGPDLFKAAYDYIPQSTVGDIINRHGITYVYYDQEQFPNIELLNQVHDSIVFQFNIKGGIQRFNDNLLSISNSLSSSIDWHGRAFSIPCDMKIGLNWGGNKEDNPFGMREFGPRDIGTEDYNDFIRTLFKEAKSD